MRAKDIRRKYEKKYLIIYFSFLVNKNVEKCFHVFK